APKQQHKRLKAKELKRLSELRVSGERVALSISTTRPAEHHARAFWFPWAERVKPHLPESLRALVRRRLAADGLHPVARFRLPGPRAPLGAELKLLRRYVATAMFESLGNDPHLVLELDPLEADRVKAVR